MAKVLRIGESQHWADYAELQKPPEPKIEERKGFDRFWILIAALGCLAFWAFVRVVVVEGWKAVR